MSGPVPWQQRPPPPGPAQRPPTPVAAVLGRLVAFAGVAAALTSCLIWLVVGGFALAAAPTCAECARGWLPPVAVGVVGPLVPLAIWVVALIAQWRHPLLLLWSVAGWPVLGAINVWAIEAFAGVLDR